MTSKSNPAPHRQSKPAEAESAPSARFEAALSKKILLVLGLLLVVWSIPRLRYASEIDAKNLQIFNRWDQSDNRFFLDWADTIAAGDLLGRTPNHPVHEWHVALAKEWLTNHPEDAKALKAELAPDADEAALHLALWNRWYGGPQFHQEPLYPYLLAGLKTLFGDAYIGGYVFQSLLGLVNGLLIFLLTRRWFGPGAAVIAGVLYAFSGFLMFHEQTILRTTATCTMTLLLVYQGLGLLDGPSRKRWILFGLTSGLAILLQSIFLLFFVGFVAIRWWNARDLRSATLRGAALCTLMIALVLAPAFARNIAVGAPTFSLSSVGSVTLIASNHLSYQSDAGWNANPRIADLVAMSESRPSAAAVATWASHDGVGSFLSMVFRKFRSALHGVEWSGNENFYNMALLCPSLRLGWVDLFSSSPSRSSD
jgi:hypothetical protein